MSKIPADRVTHTGVLRDSVPLPPPPLPPGFVGQIYQSQYRPPLDYGVIMADQGFEVLFDGYGVKNIEPGHGPSIYVEYYDGKLRLLVWADINQEEPTHTIDLSGALESQRKEDNNEEEQKPRRTTT